LETLFANWEPGDVPKKNIGHVELSAKPSVYIMDKPGAGQSIVFAAQFAPLKNSPDDISFDAMNTILGGSFTSRINMNIREDKHWSYGAHTAVPSARAQRPYFAYAPVQEDKTKETMVEIKKELADITDKRPATDDELKKIQNSITLQLPGRWETISAVAGSIGDIVNYGLADDYYTTYPEKIRNLQLANITDVAKRTLKPENLIWVVVGDRKKIEAGIRELNFGEVKILDVNGNIIQ
jgi:zinc protease